MKDIADYPDAHLRMFARTSPPDPKTIRTVHFVGICGTGMGSLAGLMQEAGYAVRGSDAAVYPPMSTRLREMGIELIEGFAAVNLDPQPDLVVVGNACSPTHVEATLARDRELTQLSFPETLAHFFLKSNRSLVVAGTHGKTTTTGMLAHILVSSGADPGFLVGGVMQNGNISYRLGLGKHFVVEGDEYDSAYFDKQPKFMHYTPVAAIVTSLEFDHADIYENDDDYREAFEQFAASVNPDGVLVLNADLPEVMHLKSHTSARVITYSIEEANVPSNIVTSAAEPGDIESTSNPVAHGTLVPDVVAEQITNVDGGLQFVLVADTTIRNRSWSDGDPDVTPESGSTIRQPVFLPMSGKHNLANALAASAVALYEGVHPQEIADAFATFGGLKRRQEVVAELNGVTIIDDFAHHPTAVRETINAIRDRWPGRRIVAVFEPRSNSSRRKVFESTYIDSFLQADVAFISSPPFRHNDDKTNFMDVGIVTAKLMASGVDARTMPDHDALKQALRETVRPGDVVLIMSNGGFGGIHGWLAEQLQTMASN